MVMAKEHPLAGVKDVFNAVMLMGDATDEVMFYGKGAGKFPTASAVVADVIDIAKKWCMIEVSTEKGGCKWREY